jgi:hypothetical protein
LIDEGIKQNKTMGEGRFILAVLQGKNTKFRAGYIGPNNGSWGTKGSRYKTKRVKHLGKYPE